MDSSDSTRDSDRDRKIREKAHEIWEREGRPEGRERDHWDMASELVAQEENAASTRRPNPASGPDAVALHDKPVEHAFIAENQGEVPGLTDQGEQGHLAPNRNNRREARES